ncbi:glutathione S-transferase family protein [Methylobacillus gramineus]|uniref:glutathione S-transferase family protein n=1 Tax=Methylobacillus gramineus TaxID=755169 RepID=UPI001CFF9268|nr:glutathione binding-like protein [Methylobacillus gramineus]MCB5184380.1 glutathione S-transferase family protein [Methylobacillus gramineus]
MTTLYVSPGACSLGAIVTLKALGIPHQLVRVALRQPGSLIYEINPLGRVPTLQLDNGDIITENAAILPFLGDLKPEAKLFAPIGSLQRARIQEWIGFANSDLHPAFRPVTRPELFVDQPEAQQQVRKKGLERLHTLLGHVERRLPVGQWLVGENFTIADAYIGVFLGWLPRADIDAESKYPAIHAYQKRYISHPAVQAALAAETQLRNNDSAQKLSA